MNSEPDVWGILTAAERLGWSDPGHTEPLESTVRRAQDYLAHLNGSEPGEGRQ